MCFYCLLLDVVEDYPVVLAANRDEYLDRPGLPPRMVRPGVFAGQDPRGGGTWLGVNSRGLTAAVTNLYRCPTTIGTARPDPVARSRGLLCLDLLEAHIPLADVQGWLRDELARHRYGDFNLAVAGPEGACVVSHLGGEIRYAQPPRGVHMIGNMLPDSGEDPKVARGRELLQASGLPAEVVAGHVRVPLEQALAMLQPLCRDHGRREDQYDAICLHQPHRGTLSSTIIAWHGSDPRQTFYMYAQGHPCEVQFVEYAIR